MYILFLIDFAASFERGSLSNDLSESCEVVLLKNIFAFFVAIVNAVLTFCHPVLQLHFFLLSVDDARRGHSSMNDAVLVKKLQTLKQR